MHPQIHVITLGVRNLQRARQFYEDGLGCRVLQDYPGFVAFDLGDGSARLALYDLEALAADAGVSEVTRGFPGFALNYLVSSGETVDESLNRARSAGGETTRPGQSAPWGGYFGYFSDLDGYLWKVASGSGSD